MSNYLRKLRRRRDINLSEAVKLMRIFDRCNVCGEMRVEVDYLELPEEMRVGLEGAEFEIDYCLYCERCKEYSVMSKIQNEGVFDEN